jgi:hypothetical protein
VTKLAFSLNIVLLAMATSCSGCMSTQLYDGAKRDRNEVARITGDPVITAGSPITVVLRRVDEHDIGIAHTSVDVLEGDHELLADCRVAETKSVSRHALKVTVYGGRKYRLRPESGPGLLGCSNVSLEAVD